jgi:aspartyl-tRNA(Asn)/glutamyl-tRNA(Gln) amidotransferase subunit C
MALSVDDVHRAAHLARIEITAAEAVDVRNKLEGVFLMIDRMRAVDTTGIVPMSHAQDVSLPLREDRVTESDPHKQDLYQRNAPAVEDGLYLVPKVIE